MSSLLGLKVRPEGFQCVAELLIVQLVSTFSDQHYLVECCLHCWRVPECFSDQSLNPVSFDGFGDVLLGNDHTESRRVLLRWHGQDQEVAISNLVLVLAKNSFEVAGIKQA